MREPFWAGFVLGLFVGAGLVLVGPWLVEQWVHWRTPVVELHPAVAVQNSSLRLTNRDSFGWKDVVIVLNTRESDEGYTFRLARLPEGVSVELVLTSFTTRKGHAFNPRTTKAFHLSLQAETPQGRGAWSGRLD
jgi:hypothetical protein